MMRVRRKIVSEVVPLRALSAYAQKRRAPFILLKIDTDDTTRLAKAIGERRIL